MNRQNSGITAHGQGFAAPAMPTVKIARELSAAAWPTLYLVDHKGIGRYRYVGSPGDEVLDHVIDGLVDEVRADAKK